ncbi:MAG: PAS domain-containing sensor histidine kinase [Candidatus Nitrosopumilus sp. bin_7KS]
MVESKEIEVNFENNSDLNLPEIYQNLYEESPGLYRTVDTKGIIISCNKSYAKNLGYSKKEIIGKTIFDHTAEKSLSTMNECFENWKSKGTSLDVEIYLERKDGSIFPVLLNAINLYDKNGKLMGSNTVLRDMTKFYDELKLKDDLILKQVEQLKKQDLQKSEFIGMVSHELKTPLVPINGYLDLILAEQYGSMNENIKSKLKIIRSSSSTLLDMISDLLDAQKMELKKLLFYKEIHNLHEIVNESISSMYPLLEKKNISIISDLQGNIACLCDKIRIKQVLTNIISNSIKYSEDGDKLHVKLNKNGSYAKIVIKDQGVGINRPKLDKIFVKFYQVDNSITREGGGTGLGLAICKGIVDNHNGKIWAESEGRGKGAEIHILLPLE